jgi:hypothetical protein
VTIHDGEFQQLIQLFGLQMFEDALLKLSPQPWYRHEKSRHATGKIRAEGGQSLSVKDLHSGNEW